MEYSLLDLLCPPLIPELSSDIAAGTSCDIHLVLVTVSTVGALPYKLSISVSYYFDLPIITAALAII